MKQVVLVEITENGSDVALFLDGEYIVEADPCAGDDMEQLMATADGLAKHFMVELIRHEHKATPDWNWNEIQDELIENGVLLNATLWFRDDVQFARFTNSLNAFPQAKLLITHLMKDLELKQNEVLEILEQAGKTANEINSQLSEVEHV